MHLSVELWRPFRLVYVGLSGEISREGLVEYLETLHRVSTIAENFAFITDLRRLDVERFGSNDVDWLVQEVAMRRGWYQRDKHCLLVTSPLPFRLARLFELQSQGIVPAELCVVSSWHGCLHWLRSDQAIPDPALRTRNS